MRAFFRMSLSMTASVLSPIEARSISLHASGAIQRYPAGRSAALNCISTVFSDLKSLLKDAAGRKAMLCTPRSAKSGAVQMMSPVLFLGAESASPAIIKARAANAAAIGVGFIFALENDGGAGAERSRGFYTF